MPGFPAGPDSQTFGQQPCLKQNTKFFKVECRVAGQGIPEHGQACRDAEPTRLPLHSASLSLGRWRCPAIIISLIRSQRLFYCPARTLSCVGQAKVTRPAVGGARAAMAAAVAVQKAQHVPEALSAPMETEGVTVHEEGDLYTRLKTLQRQLEFLEIQVSI